MKGIVVKFDKNRGFGFIRVSGKKDDIFAHVKNVEGRVELEAGQKVSFELGCSEKGPIALHIKPGGKQISPFFLFFIVGSLLTTGSAGVCVYYLSFSWGIAYFCGVNFVIFCLYGYDKQAASREKILRIPENVLHLFTLLGGTPMAFVSQFLFRHKTMKGSFRIWFWLIFIVQIGVVWKAL